MPSMSRLTFLTLRHASEGQLEITHLGNGEGKFSGLIATHEGRPLLQSGFVFAIAAEAQGEMRKILEACRESTE